MGLLSDLFPDLGARMQPALWACAALGLQGLGIKPGAEDSGEWRMLGVGKEKGKTLRPGLSSSCREVSVSCSEEARKSQFHLGLLDWYEHALVMEDETYFIKTVLAWSLL